MLLTGTHPLTNGVITNDVRVETENITTFAEALKEAGYKTCYIGKWHLYGGDRDRGIPPGENRLGFDEFYSNNCTLNYTPEVSFYFNDAGEKIKYNEWEVYGQARQAVQYIERSNTSQPFALFISFHAPHDQGLNRHHPLKYNTLPELMQLYDPNEIDLRENAEECPGDDYGATFAEIRHDYHGYYAMCTGIDIACGRIVEALQQKGVMDHSMIVYTSDHGDLLRSHGRAQAKGTPEDESIRVPLIMRYPEKLEVRNSDLMIGSLDLMPTILGLMGITPPVSCEGQNLSKAILSKNDDAVKSIPLFYLASPWRGVFTREYTYSFDLKNETGAETWNVLYVRNGDPHQRDNKFYNPNYRELRNQLHKMTFEWMDKFKDPLCPFSHMIKICEPQTGIANRKGLDGVLTYTPREAFKMHNIPIARPQVPADETTEKLMLERYNKRILTRAQQIIEDKQKLQNKSH